MTCFEIILCTDILGTESHIESRWFCEHNIVDLRSHNTPEHVSMKFKKKAYKVYTSVRTKCSYLKCIFYILRMRLLTVI